jgi:hypothetical protein
MRILRGPGYRSEGRNPEVGLENRHRRQSAEGSHERNSQQHTRERQRPQPRHGGDPKREVCRPARDRDAPGIQRGGDEKVSERFLTRRYAEQRGSARVVALEAQALAPRAQSRLSCDGADDGGNHRHVETAHAQAEQEGAAEHSDHPGYQPGRIALQPKPIAPSDDGQRTRRAQQPVAPAGRGRRHGEPCRPHVADEGCAADRH